MVVTLEAVHMNLVTIGMFSRAAAVRSPILSYGHTRPKHVCQACDPQSISNGEENIACRNKNLIRGVEREHLSLSNSVLHTGEMKAADLRPPSQC